MFDKKNIQEMNAKYTGESIENFIKESKDLLKELMPIYTINITNISQNIIFKYLQYIQFGLYIVPYLSLNEILVLRRTCKEINVIINSKICCLNYFFKIFKNQNSFYYNKNMMKNKNKIENQLRPLEEMNEESELLEQKNILNNIKIYIKSPEFSLKNLLKIYKVEKDYLKYEESHQHKYLKSLIEIRNKINSEYKVIKDKEINKKDKIEEKEEINEMKLEELKKKIEELKLKKENLLFEMNKNKKINEDLISHNNNKNKIINKLKNICLGEQNYENNEFFVYGDINEKS